MDRQESAMMIMRKLMFMLNRWKFADYQSITTPGLNYLNKHGDKCNADSGQKRKKACQPTSETRESKSLSNHHSDD